MISVHAARFGRRCVLVLALAGANATATSPEDLADPATRNAARDLARQARDHYLKSEWEPARDLYHRAYALVPAPTLAVREGRCLVELGRLVEAEEAYLLAQRFPVDASSPKPFHEAVEEAEGALTELRPRIPRVKIVIHGAPADQVVVTLNGTTVPPALIGVERTVDPGEHVVTATAEGRVPMETKFSVAEGATESVELDVGDAAASVASDRAAPGSSQKTWGFVAGGIGVVGVGVGVWQGLTALNARDDLDAVCKPTCPPSARGDLDTFRSAKTISTVAYAVGAVGLGVGAVLILTAPESESRAGVRPYLGIASAGVHGRF